MEKVEYYFREISKIPRGSYNEKAICDYVENFAKERNIKYVRDKMHNIMLFKEATKGYEDHETVMLEGHMDMVCEKNNDSDHDFSKKILLNLLKKMVFYMPINNIRSG